MMKSALQNIQNAALRYPAYFLAIVSAILFIPFLGKVHLFDWDEINFAESAREMLASGNYARVQINFKPFWEKPPFFFWLQALSMQIFGINEFAARFPNAIFGIITVLTFYHIGKKLYNSTFGLIWGVCYIGSFLPHFYFKSAIIDPVFNLFIFLGVYYLATSISFCKEKKSIKYSILSGFFTGMAVLTKGPVGFLLVFLTFLVFWAIHRFKAVTQWFNIVLFAVTILLVTSLWYGLELIENGWWFFVEFFRYQVRLFSTPDAGHEQPFFYHFVVVLIGCFPMSIWAIPSFWQKGNLSDSINFRKWAIYLFWVVMILFSIAKTKIVHYSSMCYLPLSFLAAYTIYGLIESKQKIARYQIILLLVFGTLFGLLLILVPVFAYFKDSFTPYIDDEFAVACLQTAVEWGRWEFLIGFIYLLLVWWSIAQIKKQALQGIFTLFAATAICIFFYLVIIVPQVEHYSQRPAIDFYKSIQGQDVYVNTVGFKSYAHYFYFRVPKYENQRYYDEDYGQWLLTGDVDKTVYFVTKNQQRDIEDMQRYEGIKLLYKEGGFAFFKREKAN